jgi:quercetin dioxygenase-like cupin family protein
VASATSGEPLLEALAVPQAWQHRPAPLRVFDFRKRADIAWAGGTFHARLGVEQGRASFGLLWAAAESVVPPHRHPTSWEVIALLSADGEFSQASDERSEKLAATAVTSGAQIAVPPGHKHAFASAGKQPLFAVQMYIPPGPEQRFKKLAQKR